MMQSSLDFLFNLICTSHISKRPITQRPTGIDKLKENTVRNLIFPTTGWEKDPQRETGYF
jgi:hypothetical protein